MRFRARGPRRGLRRTAAAGGVLVAISTAVLAVGAPAAQAHPLGNFTINQYHGLELYPDRVVDNVVVDTAEIPTLQERDRVDRDRDGVATAAERGDYAAGQCAQLATEVTGQVGGAALRWQVGATTMEYLPGVQGLSTSRLTCRLSAAAQLDRPADVDFATSYRADRIGWREITATGYGVRMTQASVAERSISEKLRRYPNNLLASPLNQRSAVLRTTPGLGASPGLVPQVSGANFVLRATQPLNNTFNRLAGGDLTVGVGLAAVALSILLGASHAALPGHGKTVMAAYLVGRHGGAKDALVVGATVTATHTGGVLAMGMLLSATAAVSGQGLLAWLGLLSGALIAGIGLMLLRSAAKGGSASGHGHGHGHGHGRGHSPDAYHGHGHGHRDGIAGSGPIAVPGASTGVLVASLPAVENEQRHHHDDHAHPREDGAPGHGHGHGHEEQRRFTRRGLIGLGIAGGLVPSPSALVVLLGAIALGRTWFGVGLVIGYGLGMASALIAAGLLLVRLRDRVDGMLTQRRGALLTRLAAVMPILTASLVIAVGVGLMLNELRRI